MATSHARILLRGIYPAGDQGALHAPLEPEYKVPPSKLGGIFDQNKGRYPSDDNNPQKRGLVICPFIKSVGIKCKGSYLDLGWGSRVGDL